MNYLKTKLLSIAILIAINIFHLKAQTVLIDPNGDGGFENGATFGANGWTLVNGSGANQWFVGNTGGAITGTQNAYISADNGLTNSYNTSSPSRIHFYKDITFPANETSIKLSFKWQAQGESFYDYLLVCAMPISQTPVANVPATAGYANWNNLATSYPGSIILSSPPYLNLQGTTQIQTIELPPGFAGTTRRLVFMWSNDETGGITPPISVDSIALVSRLPETIHSAASGNYSDTSTWLGGSIPTNADSVIIDSGHIIVLDGPATIALNYLELNGVINFSPNTTTLTVANNLYISATAVLNVFNNATGKNLVVSGNITNDGVINLAKLGATLMLDGTSTQTLDGSGRLDSNNIISTLKFNNTSTQPIINWGWQNTIVSRILNLNGGWISMGSSNSITIGNGSPGTLNVTSGGFTDGTLKRWFATAGTGTSIFTGFPPAFSSGSYPFISGSAATGYYPAYFHRSTATLTSAGTFDVTFNNSPGLHALSTAVSENGYNVSKQTNATWTVSTSNGYTSSFDHLFAIQGQGLYKALTLNVRLLRNETFTGTHQAGLMLPLAQRAAIPAASIAGVYTLGIDSIEEISYTIASGAWNDPSIWSNGVPSCNKAAEISPSDSIWINGSMPPLNASYLIVSGNLTVSGSVLNIGCNNNNSSAQISGKLYLIAGSLTINGSLKFEPSATFSQTGGNIVVDGNAGGNIFNSVPSGTPIATIATSNLTLSGGIFTIIDPHTGTSSSSNNIAFSYTGSASINNTNGWTLKFGDGLSTDAGGALTTPIGFLMNTGGGKIVIDSLVIDAGMSGLNRFVTLSYTTPSACNNLYLTSAGDARINFPIYIANNLTNNGNLVTIGTIYLGTFLNTTAGASSNIQTISGTGSFKNIPTSSTANFANLIINNTNTTGVIFANKNSLRSNTNTGTISNAFTLTKGFINTLNDTFVLGVNASSIGSFNFSNDSGGFIPGCTFSRWWGTSISGSSITKGQVPNSATGAYPFTTLPKPGIKAVNRVLSLRQTTTSSIGGRINVTYIDSTGTKPASINDGGYIIDKISNAKWIISYNNINGSGIFYTASLNGEGIYLPSNSNSRIVSTTAALSGTHQIGTILPNVQRTGIALSDLNSTWTIGLNSMDAATYTVASGDWNNPLIWSGGNVPGCNEGVVILPEHSVTVSTSNATVRSINITSGGMLTIADSSLTVGCSSNNTPFIVNGILNVTGGTLNVNGNLDIQPGATFLQNGGKINIDGNDGGNTNTSVPSGTPIVSIATSNLTLSGGVLTIIDPHTGTVSSANNIAFSYTGTTSINNTSGWTLKFGNGTSTDAGGALTTPIGFVMNITGGKIVIDSLVIDAGINGVNRFVNLGVVACNNLYITNNGDARIGVSGSTLYVSRNIINNGNLVTTGTLYLGTYFGSTEGASANSQTISGTGSFRNSLSASTGNYANLSINNNSSAGVIFANRNTLYSANMSTVSGTFRLTKGLVNTLNDTFVLGTSMSSIGLLIYTNDSGGFVSGSIFSRWWTGSAGSGATITNGQVPNTALGAYPFTTTPNTNGKFLSRSLWLKQNGGVITGGRISVKYIDDNGLTAASINDGNYVIDSLSKAKWAISYTGITGGAPNYVAAVNAEGMFSASNLNSRITSQSSALTGTHQPGTLLPHAQRTGIVLSDLNDNIWYVGISRSDIINQTIASGNWNDTLIWSKRTIPTCTDSVVISPGHTVTVNAPGTNAKGILISKGAELFLSDSNSLTIGCTNNNASFAVNGTLTVAGGNLVINGSLKIAEGATFNQSGGSISIDGNAGGVLVNSVPATANLLDINSNLVNWTGGTLTIVDPHAQHSAYAFKYTNTASVDVSVAHTLFLGNGISSDVGNAGLFLVNSLGNYSANSRFNFGNVTIKGSANAIDRRKVSPEYNFIVRGDFKIENAGIFEILNTLKVGGNISVDINGKLIAQYITLALGSGNGVDNPSPTPQTISGRGTFINVANTPLFSTSTFIINNTSAGGVTIAMRFSSREFTLINGIVHTTAADSFLLGSMVSGGSNSAYIDGPCYMTFKASRTETEASTGIPSLPLGKNGRYLPIGVSPTTTSSGTITIKSEAFSNTNIPSGATSMSSFKWETRVVVNPLNFTGAYLQLSDTSQILTDSSRILYAPDIKTNYVVTTPASTYTPGTTKFLRTVSKIAPANFNGFFTYGKLATCEAPTSQPTSFIASNIQGTAFDASFNRASDTSNYYLVLGYASGAVATSPVNHTNYETGSFLGTGIVIKQKADTVFSHANLLLNTDYDYRIYSYNNSGCAGPVYNTISPLMATVRTCASTLPAPTALISSGVHIDRFTVKWNKSTIPGASYNVDVSASSDFSNYLPGYQSTSISDTFIAITGATPSTSYYVRVRTNSNNCSSAPSITLTVKTLCAPTGIPYILNFENSLVCNTAEKIGGGNSWGVTISPGNGFTSRVLIYPSSRLSDANAWYYTQAINLTSGIRYRISFQYGSKNSNTTSSSVQKLAIVYGSSPLFTTMNDTITIIPFINNETARTFAADFTPTTTGIYFIGLNCFASKGTRSLYIDDIKVDASPASCGYPETLSITDVTAYSARLSWKQTSPIPAGGYLYYLQSNRSDYPTNETTATGIISGTDSSFMLTDLTPGKTYDVWMRSNCGSDSTSWSSMPVSFTTSCGIVRSFPWKEDFEEVNQPELPSCLSTINANNDTDSFIIVSTRGSGPSNTKAASLYTLSNGGANNDYLILPRMKLNGKQQLRYQVWSDGYSTPNDYRILLSTTGKNPSDFSTILKPLTIAATASNLWDSVNLANYNDTVYIAFHVPQGGLDGNYLFIDDITIEDLPPCVALTTLTRTFISPTSFGAEWGSVFPIPSNGYQWEMRTSGTPESGAIGLAYSDSSLATNVLINGLIPDSSYTLYVRSNCGGIYSTWKSLSFRTLCMPSGIPFSQNFESAVVPNISKCDRIENAGSGNNWVTANNPGSGFTTKALKYASTSSPANAWYYTQGLNLTAGIAYRLKFKYGCNTYTYTENLLVKYDTLPTVDMKDTLGILIGITSPIQRSFTKDFIPATTGVYYIGFNCFSNANQYNLYLDDITVELSPCLSPGSISVSAITTTSATFKWLQPLSNPTNGYEWEVRTSGNAGSGAIGLFAKGSDSLKTLTSIIDTFLPNTQYKFYVRSNCGGEFSVWDSVIFRTNCLDVTVPFMQDFESITAPDIPLCDKIETEGTLGNWKTINNPGNGFNSKALVYTPFNTAAKAWYYTQGIRLKGGVTYRLTFDYGSSGYYSYQNEKLAVRYGSSPTYTAMRDTLALLTSIYGERLFNYSVEFTPPSSGTYYLGFNCFSDGNKFNLYIDNISLEAPYVLPTNITVNMMTPNNGYMLWDAPSLAPSKGYEWEIRSSGNGGSGLTGRIAHGTSDSLSTNIAGLLANTQYTAYIRSNYDSGYFSSWASSAFNTSCIVASVPYLQNFESAVVPNIPYCDKMENAGTGNNWETLNDPFHGITGKVLAYNFNYYPANAWYYTKGISLTKNSVYRLTFKYRINGLYTEKLSVRYGASPIASLMNDTLGIFVLAGEKNIQTLKIDFIPSSTSVYYLGFNCFSEADQATLYIDDISLVSLPDCITQDSLKIGTVLYNAVTFNWKTPIKAPTGGYDWEIRSPNGVILSGNTAALSVSATGLIPSTEYNIYVRSNCGGTFSTWDSATFTTPCAPVTPPYVENFESVVSPDIPACSKTETSNTSVSNWKWITYHFTSTTSTALYLQRSGGPWEHYVNNAWYYTRGIRLTGGVAYRLKFHCRTNSIYSDERLVVKYGNDSKIAAMNNMLSNIVLATPKPSSIIIDFIPTTTDIYYIGLNAVSDNNNLWQSDLIIDDITVEELPACISPLSMKSTKLMQDMTTINWSVPALPPSNGYEWELRQSGRPNSGVTGLTAKGVDSLEQLSATITGLTPGTRYTFYIRSRCNNGYGVWDSLIFSTLCVAVNTPYIVDFESVGYNVRGLTCNTTEYIGETDTWFIMDYSRNGFSTMILAYAPSSINGANSWFYTRGLNLTGGKSYKLSFKSRLGTVTVKYGLAPSSDSMNTTIGIYTPLTTTTQTNTQTFTPATTGIYFIGLNVTSNYNLNIDDISIQEVECLPPGTITMSPIVQNAATIQWTASASAPGSGYEWEVRTSGNAGSGGVGLTAKGTASGTLSAIVPGLTLGTSYKVYVRSNCGSMFSSWDSSTFSIPVSLITFNGKANDDHVLLNWSTASEINNKGFVIERSTNGNAFSKIGFVRGKGNSDIVVDYAEEDEHAFSINASKILYYRLLQQDFDGRESSSPIIKVEKGKDQLLSHIEARPNPFTNEVNIVVESTEQSTYTIVISDIQGKPLSTTDVSVYKGLNTITLKNAESLSAGVYILKLSGPEQHTIKLVKSQ